MLAARFSDAAGQSAPDRPVILIDIKGAIGFVSAGQLTKALERAAAQGAPAVIVRLDTPGGLLSSTREMIHTILASRIPMVMYVAPNGAVRPAPAPISSMRRTWPPWRQARIWGPPRRSRSPHRACPARRHQNPAPGPEKQPECGPGHRSARKSLNDAVAYIRSLAELRGRNADWGEKAVRDAASSPRRRPSRSASPTWSPRRRRAVGSNRRRVSHDRGR